MGYVKVAYRKIFEQLDSNYNLPKGWNEFVEKKAIPHNLIIKSSKNKCHCTNCNYDFFSTKKVNEEEKCPICKNKYLIKRSNLKYLAFKDYLAILDYVDDIFVIRYFELKTIIDASHRHHSSAVEFAREIPSDNYYREIYVNERVSKCQCYIYIHHSSNSYFNSKKWRLYTRNYSLIDYAIVFPNNMKELLKNTDYKYSNIWEIAKHSNYIDLVDLIRNKNVIDRVEILSKMKLYNLALQAGNFNTFGSFKDRFGVSKDFYPFMKKNNITYKQLEILKLLQEKDIKKIRHLETYSQYSGEIAQLKDIAQYISLSRFVKYSRQHHGKVRMYLYADYLRFAKELGYDLKNDRYAFPENLEKEHDRLEKQYVIHKNKKISRQIIQRAKKLAENTFQDKKFIVFPAPKFEALIDESMQQNNCVRTYAERYAKGDCDIYFMRDITKQNKSLVTVEVRNNKVYQSRIKYNNSPNEKQIKFLQQWEDKVLKGAA